jgi:catechol 2,3-dioxygenase-like lactoylglutathione lyase family enzyme
MTLEINSLVPELWCSNFKESLYFYTSKLGFEIAQQRGNDPHAYLSLQGVQIMLAHWKFDGSWEPWYPAPMERPFGRGINLQFMIKDVQKFHDRAVAAGVMPFLALHEAEIWRTDRIDARIQFMVLDPDGYVLRFSETTRHRPIEPPDMAALDAYYGSSSQ